MEASDQIPAAEATTAVDVSQVHAHLDEAERLFHEAFAAVTDPDALDDVARFSPHLSTVRMVADQAADLAGKAVVG